jgi:hypothetical protein
MDEKNTIKLLQVLPKAKLIPAYEDIVGKRIRISTQWDQREKNILNTTRTTQIVSIEYFETESMEQRFILRTADSHILQPGKVFVLRLCIRHENGEVVDNENLKWDFAEVTGSKLEIANNVSIKVEIIS